MTPGDRRRLFLGAVRAQIRRRGLDVETAVLRMLGTMVEFRARIEVTLENQPTDFDATRLPELSRELDRHIGWWRRQAIGEIDAAVETALTGGAEMVAGPLSSIGIQVGMTIVPDSLLKELSAFAADKISGVSDRARQLIEREIELTVLGGQAPSAAMEAIGSHVGQGHLNFIGFRAETIVRTEMGKIQSGSNWRRMQDVARVEPELKKRWVWSGKSRSAHAAVDGKAIPWNEPFIVGGEEMMHPHDPNASAENVINCGCRSVPEIRHLL